MENTRERLETLEKTIEEADLAGIKVKLDQTGSLSHCTSSVVCMSALPTCYVPLSDLAGDYAVSFPYLD
jgi:hypothetical protein